MMRRGLVTVGNTCAVTIVRDTGEVVTGRMRWRVLDGNLESVQVLCEHDPPTECGTVAEGVYRDGRGELWLVRYIVNDPVLIDSIRFAADWRNSDDYDWEAVAKLVRSLDKAGVNCEHLGMPEYHSVPFIVAEVWTPEHIRIEEEEQGSLFGEDPAPEEKPPEGAPPESDEAYWGDIEALGGDE